VTTYSGVLGKRDLVLAQTGGYSVYKLNLGLLLATVMLAGTYIFLANFAVAQKYSLGFNKNKLNNLIATTVLEERFTNNNDVGSLLIFAQKSGMVEAKDTESILQDRNFAITP